ncbi:MAG: hypothetical protein PUE24_04905, partial [Clostridiales bacterium]|nr:hypothetical protein [Clostridiales bacterium]
ASRISSRAAKPARYENLKVFIRSDVHAVKAGIKLKRQLPLNNPKVFDRLRSINALFSIISLYSWPCL